VVAEDPRLGQIVGDRFRLDRLIGRGAMADVYQALDQQTQGAVAIKVLRHTHLTDAVSKARFAREAEVQAKLRHRNIAALLATGVTDRLEPFLAVELLRGKTLRGVIKNEGQIAPVRAASYAWQALSGLSAVHAQGILHRDLKPANIMLEPSPGPVDRVVLIDFGFASFDGGARLTAQGTVVGSLTYIAPERLRGEPADHRSDLYAVGVILFELLTGVPPFRSDDDFELMEMHVHDDAPSVRSLDPSLPVALEQVIACALQKHQADRYATATAMADALELAAQQLGTVST
jgi:eukaryotic-like serine/threonine-protein kinase